MFIINLYRYFAGYVEICVTGEFCEKILNLFSAHRVNVWDIEIEKNSIRLKLYVKDFEKIREIRGKLKLHIRILKRYGFIFLAKKYMLRLGLPVGVLLFFLTLNILSMFVWNITVVGNSKVGTKEILQACENIGVKNGIRVKGLDSQLLRERLLLECGGLSWCSFNIEGSKITVNVTEVKKSGNESTPCNIVSDYDCVITEILAETGVPAVEKGQAVRKGDLLVSGISDVSGVNKFIHAKASIRAEITETVEVSGSFSQEKRVQNGTVKNKKVIEFFGLKIPLYLGKVCEEFDSELSVGDFYLFGEKMPARAYNKTFYMCDLYEYEYTREELLQELSGQMDEKIKAISQNSEVISRNISENDKEIILKYEIRYNKSIGLKENLIFDVSN